jgi:hypothetical protein
MSQKAATIVYWTTTVLFAIPLAWSAIQYLVEAPRMMHTMVAHLGYPEYFPKILGAFKLLGVAALVYPRFPRLKEWAYAGFTFDLVGASLSHLAVGDGALIAAVPLAFLVLLVVSYVTWRRSVAPSSHRAQKRVPWGLPA